MACLLMMVLEKHCVWGWVRVCYYYKMAIHAYADYTKVLNIAISSKFFEFCAYIKTA